MTTTTMAIDTGRLDEEQRDDRFGDLVRRLSHQSVVKHFDAYADVDWDHPDYAIDPTDPRWELPPDSPLATTDWYRSLPAGLECRAHARFGFQRTRGQTLGLGAPRSECDRHREKGAQTCETMSMHDCLRSLMKRVGEGRSRPSRSPIPCGAPKR